MGSVGSGQSSQSGRGGDGLPAASEETNFDKADLGLDSNGVAIGGAGCLMCQ